MWVNSQEPDFEAKMTEIVGLYLNPLENALVLSVDEKTSIQALGRKYPPQPMEPGKTERVDHEYIRHGTKSLIAALLVHNGEVIGKCYDRHRHQEFLDFLDFFEIIENHFPHKELVDSIMKFIKQYNKEEKPFRWTYTGEPLGI